MSGEELVRVQSLDELRAGMTVWTKGCLGCDGNHADVLVRSEPSPCDCGATSGFKIICNADCVPLDDDGEETGEAFCYCEFIKAGRLYRLRDLDGSAEQNVSKRRELERTS